MTRRYLYLISGVMCRGSNFDVIPGLLLASSEDEARGSHIKWMQTKQPDMLVHSVSVRQVADNFIAQAALEVLKDG